jgi:alpha-tubulin suppressor-like RCC1 family protein
MNHTLTVHNYFMRTQKNFIQTVLLLAALLLAAGTGQAQIVTQAKAGELLSMFVKSDGSLWGMGINNYGQLGDGTTTQRTNPVQIVASGVRAVACGYQHTLFVKSNGSLWAMGDNSYGQLGDGTTTQRTNPVQVVASGVTAVAAGYINSFFLKSDGSLWGMGNASLVGDGTTNGAINRTNPVQIVASGVTAVVANNTHFFLIKSDGSLWGWGDNLFGDLGDGTSIYRFSPVQIVSSGVAAVSAGEYYYSLFAKSDGSLWGMGNNQLGQLGDGTIINRTNPVQIIASGVTAVACGYYHSLFVKTDGSLWGMGVNAYGQLGDGIYNFGNFQAFTNQPEMVVASGVTAAACGWFHSLFVKSDGSLWGMGYDAYGQLGGVTGLYVTNRPVQILQGIPLPTITLQPTNYIVAPGGNATFSVGVSNAGAYTYQWQLNGTNISGANSTSYTVTSAGGTNVGSYTVVVCNGSSCVTSSAGILTITGLDIYAGLVIYGAVGANYRVDYSQVLRSPTNRTTLTTNWTTLTNFTLPSNPYLFIDPTPARQGSRFYRTVMP